MLTEELEKILKPAGDPRLQRLVAALAAAERPESVLSYLRGQKANEFLTRIGDRDLELSHQAFDRLPRSAALEHIRALLIHHNGLPPRGDESIARFKTWLDARLDSLPDDGTKSSIRTFATWRHLKRLRGLERDGRHNIETATHAAKQEITEAGRFLLWLRETHDAGVDDIHQMHIDEYLSTGTTTRRHIRNYIHWLRRGRRGTIDVPYRVANSTPMVTQEQRLEMIRNCLELDQVTIATRIAGLIFLLWAQPLNRIVALRQGDVHRRVDGLLLRLGTTPTLVPAELAATFGDYFAHPSNQQTGNTSTDWIFPGFRAGRHLHEGTLSERLKLLGIDAQRARNATLQNLAQQIDARSLINLLGYSGKVITLHAARAGAPMSDYVDLRRSAIDVGPEPHGWS